MGNEQINLILGCYGRKEDDFVLCPAIDNKILQLHENLLHIDDIWVYFEGIGLLDKPMINLNAIRNVLYRMQDKYDQNFMKLWSEKDFNIIERFVQMHKPCGLYLKLTLQEEEPMIIEPVKTIKDNVVSIKAIKSK